MKHIISLVFFISITAVCRAQNITKILMVNGLRREYILHLPSRFTSVKLLPVIIALHGGGATAAGAPAFYNLEALAGKNNFIIVYPNAINKTWHIPGMASRVNNADTSVNDLRFINLLLDTLISNYKADPSKIFCTGISRGAMFSYYLAGAMNERIKAIAAVCGGISRTRAPGYVFAKPVNVLMINGTDDPLISYNGGFGKLNKHNKGNEDADLIPTEDLLKKILTLNHCQTNQVTTKLPDNDTNDDCTETEYKYDCENVMVDFIRIENGGHTWAGGTQYLPKFLIGRLCKDFSASEKVFDFFMHVK